jgi:hypothetical protein
MLTFKVCRETQKSTSAAAAARRRRGVIDNIYKK